MKGATVVVISFLSPTAWGRRPPKAREAQPMRIPTTQQLADLQQGIESIRQHLRRIHAQVLPRTRRRLEKSDQTKSETIGRQLESAQRLHDDG